MKAFVEKNKMANGNGSSDGIQDWVRDPVSSTYEAHVVFITPEIAKLWLARNTDNRNLRRGRARVLGEDMERGQWRENGESMSFDTNGVLVNGQHRLQAVINSGHGFMATVTLGVEPDVRPTVDTGLKRSAGDILKMQGEQYGTHLATTTQLWARYASGELERGFFGSSKLSHQQVLDMIDLNPDIRHSVQYICRQQRGLIAHSDAAFLHYAIVRSGELRERANEFMDRFLDGWNLDIGNPILALRNRIIVESKPGARMSKHWVIALVLKAYKIWRKGKESKYLKFKEGESFPMLAIRPVRSGRKERIW